MNLNTQTARVVQPPASVASTATTTMTFDTIGYDYAIVDVLLGTQATTDPAFTTLKFTESDDTVLTNFTAIQALTGGTVTNTTSGYILPLVTVSGLGGGIQFQIDLRKRKRYLKMNATPGTTLIYGAVVSLSRGETAPLTAAQKSVANNPGATAATGVMTLVAG